MALAGTSLGYFSLEKRVTLADEDRVRTVDTFATDVGSLLYRLGVRLEPGDRVMPTMQSPLREKIEIRRARNVLVVVNGSRTQARATGRTVSEVLNELGIDSSGALVLPGPDELTAENREIVVAQPVEVTVTDGGKSKQVVTNSLTAGALLRGMGVILGPQDRVEPSIIAYPAEGGTIRVIRVREVVERTHSKIAFKKVVQRTDQLEFGIRRIAIPGSDGVLARIYNVTYEDGRVESKVFLGTEVVRSRLDQVTLLGTRRPLFINHGGGESGKATWYRIPGLSAAHRTLPFGTVVRVTNLANGSQVDVVIRDRGPYGDGRVIDLSDTAFREIAPVSSGIINVKLQW